MISVFVLQTALIGGVGCVPDRSSESRRSALVFGSRDVRQARNHLQNAVSHAVDSKNRQLDAILMMQSMPTGIVYSMQPEDRIEFDTSGNASCTSPENPGTGSGFLTSSTRLATAHHVVWPFEEPKFVVRFGGHGTIDPVNDRGGSFIADQPAQSWDEPFPVFDRYSENFLFGNRLFQLGLGDWTDPTDDDEINIREAIRTWKFRIDGKELVSGSPDDFEHQGFVSLGGLPTRIEGEDVAFLVSAGLVEFDEKDFGESGKFPFSNPGMFFDAVSTGSISADNSDEIDAETPLVGLHSSVYPDADSVHYGQLISRTGSFRGKASASTSFCLGGQISVFDKTNLISTDLDLIESSSGGAVLGCPSAAGQSLDRGRVACEFTIDGKPAPDQDHIGTPRAQGVVANLDVPRNEVERQAEWSRPVTDESQYSSEVTLWSEQAEEWTGRDRGNPSDPFHPVIERHPGERSPPCKSDVEVEPVEECNTDSDCKLRSFCQDSTCHECLSWSTEARRSYFGDPARLQYSFGGAVEQAEEDKAFETGTYSFPDPTDPKTRRQQVRCGSLMRKVDRQGMDAPSCSEDADCDFLERGADSDVSCTSGRCDVPPYYGAGVLIGFRGTATNWQNPDNMTIGGLQPVCAPWTSVPWSQNWRFLMSLGPTLPPDVDSRGMGPGAGILPLWGKAPLQYENRVDTTGNGEVVWPHSMKLCPPNYFVVDVEIIPTTPEDVEGKIVGMASLVCAAGPGNPEHEAGKTVTVPLHHDTPWEMGNGLDVSLSQFIGNPEVTTGTARVGGCGDHEAWSGFRTRHNKKR